MRIPSLRKFFAEAGASKSENLSEAKLFPLIDALTVRRDRAFIKERYRNERFTDGTLVKFPEPELQERRYDLDSQPPVYPNSSPDHRACNSLTPFRCPHRRPSLSIGGFGLRGYLLCRSARPGRAPVLLPPSTTTVPLTMTYSIPIGNCFGSVRVAGAFTLPGWKTVRSALNPSRKIPRSARPSRWAGNDVILRIAVGSDIWFSSRTYSARITGKQP